MSYLEPIARQLDRCDFCGRKVHRKDLIRTQMMDSLTIGENLFEQSTYDGTYWTANPGNSQGNISIGPYADKARCKIANDGTVTEVGGSPTFAASAVNVQIEAASGMDLSSYSSVVFSVIVGPYHANTSRVSMTVEVGFTDGSNEHYETWTGVDSMLRVWIYTTIATLEGKGLNISSVKPYVKMVPGSISRFVFVEDFQLESNVTKPGTFVKTSGSAITRTAPASRMVILKLCPECREIKILSTSDTPIRQEIEPMVPTHLQEI